MTEPISLAVAQRICRLSRDIRKRIALLIDSRGRIAEVILGDNRSIIIPRIKGRERLKSYRLIHTHLKPVRQRQKTTQISRQSQENSPSTLGTVSQKLPPQILDEDDLYDLVLLQMDATTGLLFDANGFPEIIQSAYLAHDNSLGYAIEDHQLFRHSLQNGFGENLLEYKRKNSRRNQKNQTHSNRALLVGVYTDRILISRNSDIEESMQELRELAKTAGFHVVDTMAQRRSQLDPLYLVGKGKAKQIAWKAVTSGAEIIVFDLEISAAQARRIEAISDLKVLDRTQIILNIFSKRANSQDGKIQVELAQLRYEKNRLSERDDRRSRLVGGIGTRGPGETSMEVGKRHIQDKIRRLEKKLQKIRQRRQLNRKVRRENMPAVAVIGYTNAGKSTLLNALTFSNIKTDDALFVTLDPSSRKLRFPNQREIILIDTVGFTREIPPVLSGAFQAIFEEMQSADLLLHLIDRSDPSYQKKIQSIEENILSQLSSQHIPRLQVFNKVDQLPDIARNETETVCISAKKKWGFSELLKRIDEKLINADLQTNSDNQNHANFSRQ